MRFYVPLAPVVILAAVASVNACSKQEAASERLRVVPPPAAVSAAPTKPTAPVLAAAPEPKQTPDSVPSAEEVKAFHKPVAK
ncbi:MAG: hypothetical protein QM704_21110 [Anaeromyxobacteraceae bacterium]